MKDLISLITAVLMITTLVVAPLYAHHANEFLSKAMEMNRAEARFAEMAVQKAQNPRVKEYAEMIVQDDNQAMKTMKQLHAARMAPATAQKGHPDVQLTANHQRTLDKLSNLSGNAFDREFINTMITGNREAIRLYEAQAKAHGANKQTGATGGQGTTREKPSAADHKYSTEELERDADTADFANEILPKLRMHLEQALEIQKEL